MNGRAFMCEIFYFYKRRCEVTYFLIITYIPPTIMLSPIHKSRLGTQRERKILRTRPQREFSLHQKKVQPTSTRSFETIFSHRCRCRLCPETAAAVAIAPYKSQHCHFIPSHRLCRRRRCRYRRQRRRRLFLVGHHLGPVDTFRL